MVKVGHRPYRLHCPCQRYGVPTLPLYRTSDEPSFVLISVTWIASKALDDGRKAHE
jgi:hypothetical protein